MSATANLGLPFIDAGQAQKHVTHNEALRALDTLVQLAVRDRDLAAPPGSPAEGQRWIVKTGATGAWSGHVDEIAAWQDGAWVFSAPAAGWVAYVIDEEILVAWDGASWNAVSASGGDAPTELQNLSLLGVGATADAANPVSAKLNNVLWAAKTVAEGGDGTLRHKLSKESAAKVLSLLFQDNFSGRAEIGLIGDDDFHFRVSPDGSSWLEAIRIDYATGRVSFPSGGVREVLTANRTYYVRTDGSDSNNGLANTSAGAFATLQKAADTIWHGLDLAGFNVAVQVGAGTYTSGVTVTSALVGIGTVSFVGDTTTPSNVTINSPVGFSVSRGAELSVSGFKVTGTGTLVGASEHGRLFISGKMEYGTAAGGIHIAAFRQGYIEISAGYTISGGAGQHLQLNQNSVLILSGSFTIALTGTPAFSTAFINYNNASTSNAWSSVTFTGSATGTRYTASRNAVLDTNGGGANFFPGNSAGSTASGGQYL